MEVKTLKLTGKPVAEFLGKNIMNRIKTLNDRNIAPKMLIIRVGSKKDDIFYQNSILKKCNKFGIETVVKELPADATNGDLVVAITEANKNSRIHGIMLLRPLPEQINSDYINNLIDCEKDIDCMSPVNLGKVFEGKNFNFAPCTAMAVIEMLKYYKIPLEGANIALVGRSLVVGKPLSMLLLNENATVTMCHSKTKDLKSITSKSDIVISAVGKAKFMNHEYFTESSIVIDVGINDDGNGKMCGDVDFDDTFGKVKALNPAVGGVGAITTAILLQYTVKACENLNNFHNNCVIYYNN